MNAKIFFTATVLSIMACMAAEPFVSGVTARQNWPWNANVDIRYTLTADVPCDIDVRATWSGQNTPVSLKHISGDLANIVAGNGHIVWDPIAEGVTLPLTGFRVTVEPATVDSRKYLLLNLADGSVFYSATEPDWKNEPLKYLATNIVFRRISATTFNFGYPQSQVEAEFINNRSLMRRVTLSSDYYMAIFPLTSAQRDIAIDRIPEESDCTTPYAISYDMARGTRDEGICWPETFHKVTPDSFLGTIREISKNSFPVGWVVDLPTAAQWENAARAGTDKLDRLCWVEGSEFGVDFDAMMAIVKNAGQWDPDKTITAEIGKFAPNPWGIYDTMGCVYEFVLDWRMPKGPTLTTDVTDPTGIATPESEFNRQVRGGRGNGSCAFQACLPGNSGYGFSADTYRSTRLCIHMKPVTKIAE